MTEHGFTQTIHFGSQAALAAALAYLITCHHHTVLVHGMTLSVDACGFHCLWDAELVDETTGIAPYRVTDVTEEPVDSPIPA